MMHGITLHSLRRNNSRRSRWSAQKLIASCICLLSAMHIVFVSHYIKKIPHPSNSFGNDGPVDGNAPIQKYGLTNQDHHADQLQKKNTAKATIAFAVSLTSCSAKFTADGAAILKHSIHLASYPINENSKYSYKMFLFVHPSALECSKPFEKLGYEVLVKEVPINVSEIEGTFLREHVYKSGCCGDKEFLKLYAYTLMDFPIVVHLDLDSLILQPLDELFDAMLGDESHSEISVMYNNEMPRNIEAFFSKDYNMINPGHKHPGVQGGFLVIKPNMEYFEEYKSIILKGDFRSGGGWDGKYGGYFGAQQIQGLCSYFFEDRHPGTAVELNRCIYNAMNDGPYGKKRGTKNEMACRDGKKTCEDCRDTKIELVKSVHFTLCQKPWTCPVALTDKLPLCKEFHKKWFQIRKSWDGERGITMENVKKNDIFQGYCNGQGERNYKSVTIV